MSIVLLLTIVPNSYLHAPHIAGYCHWFLLHGILEELTTFSQQTWLGGGADRHRSGACRCAGGGGGGTVAQQWTTQLIGAQGRVGRREKGGEADGRGAAQRRLGDIAAWQQSDCGAAGSGDATTHCSAIS